MSKAFKVTVERVKWFTTGKGFVKPIAVLDKSISKTKNKEKVEFDSLALDNAKQIEKMSIGRDAVLKIKLNSAKRIKVMANENEVKFELPKNCPTCGTELKAFDNDLYCESDVCDAKSRTPIVKLARLACGEDLNLSALYTYINNYPINSKDSRFSIQSITDFLSVFSNAGKKDTNFRDELLKEVYGEDYDEVSNIERKIAEKFQSGLSGKELWYVSSIKGINSFTADQLANIDFSPMTSLSYEQQLTNLVIDADTRANAILNKAYMKNLHKNIVALRYK